MKILITGAAGGIAYDVGKSLVKKGHVVYFTTHTKKQEEVLKKRLKNENIEATCFSLDVTKKQDRSKIDDLELDCLWSHASVGYGGAILALDIDALRENYEVNIFASFSLIQQFYQNQIKKSKGGKIFVTSSLASMLPLRYLGSYTSSKAAISMLAFTLKRELALYYNNISITLVEPGCYHTGFNQVMIDNKSQFEAQKNIFSEHNDFMTKKQHQLFSLLEKKSNQSIVKKIVHQMEKEHSSFKVRAPIMQRLATKLFVIFFR